MLRYAEIALSRQEVPGEVSVCVYISGCSNRCLNCHYPELMDPDYGIPLLDNIQSVTDLYLSRITCVCFMGEGNCSAESREELLSCVCIAKEKGLKCCLYSGRDTDIEAWMYNFDFIKLGSYRAEKGPIYEEGTNQRLYKKHGNRFMDITERFWR